MIQTGKLIADRYVVQNSPNINPGQQVIFEAYQEKELFKLGIVEQVTAETIHVRDEKDSLYTRNHEEVYEIKMDIQDVVNDLNEITASNQIISDKYNRMKAITDSMRGYLTKRFLPAIDAVINAETWSEMKNILISLVADIELYNDKFTKKWK